MYVQSLGRRWHLHSHLPSPERVCCPNGDRAQMSCGAFTCGRHSWELSNDLRDYGVAMRCGGWGFSLVWAFLQGHRGIERYARLPQVAPSLRGRLDLCKHLTPLWFPPKTAGYLHSLYLSPPRCSSAECCAQQKEKKSHEYLCFCITGCNRLECLTDTHNCCHS